MTLLFALLIVVCCGGDVVATDTSLLPATISIVTRVGVFVGDATANTTVFVDVRLQRAHMHSPSSPLLAPDNEGMTIDMHSEKNLSPLSSGNTSAHGKGTRQPTSAANWFAKDSSE